MGLEDLLKQREENFRDHIEKRKKKFLVAMQRIFHPFTLLTLAYVGFMIFNTEALNTYAKLPYLETEHRSGLIT